MINTEIFDVQKSFRNTVIKAARLLLQKQIVVIPTETVYGLAADATSDTACNKIFIAKNRPKTNPLIVHCADINMAEKCIKQELVKEKKTFYYAEKLLHKFSPGALTVICYSSDLICQSARAGGKTVAIRIPNHNVCKAIIQQAGVPIAAPSANVFTRPSPTDVQSAYKEMKNKVAAVIDGGVCELGIESTIVDCTQKIPRIVRPGDITNQEIYEVCIDGIKEHRELQKIKEQFFVKKHIVDNVNLQNKNIPGNDLVHYSPRCDVFVKESSDKKTIFDFCTDYNLSKKKVLYLSFNNSTHKNIIHKNKLQKNVHIQEFVSWSGLAHILYRSFFDAETKMYDCIVVDCPQDAEHHALRNRILKSAAMNIKV